MNYGIGKYTVSAKVESYVNVYRFGNTTTIRAGQILKYGQIEEIKVKVI